MASISSAVIFRRSDLEAFCVRGFFPRNISTKVLHGTSLEILNGFKYGSSGLPCGLSNWAFEDFFNSFIGFHYYTELHLKTFTKERKKARTEPKDPCKVPPEKVFGEKVVNTQIYTKLI